MRHKRGRPPTSRVAAFQTLREAAPSLEELEARLEKSFLPLEFAGPPRNPVPFSPVSEPCGCLGALCACDGHDCAGVCEEHCLVNYV